MPHGIRRRVAHSQAVDAHRRASLRSGYPADPRYGADGLQRPLRSHCRRRLKAGRSAARLREGGTEHDLGAQSSCPHTRWTSVVTESRQGTKESNMKLIKGLTWAMWSLALTLTAIPALAADYPRRREAGG